MRPTTVLFVCLGNICRSPAAHGIFQQLVDKANLTETILIDSAGTGNWHVGELPNRDMRAAAELRGLELRHRARQFERSDFKQFEWILAMDRQNQRDILSHARTDEERQRVALFRDYDPQVEDSSSADVPDPYGGARDGFNQVLDICERTCANFLAHLQRELVL